MDAAAGRLMRIGWTPVAIRCANTHRGRCVHTPCKMSAMRCLTVILTIPVVVMLLQPLRAPRLGAGLLGEVAAFGVWGCLAAVTLFFGLVALYCRSLQHLADSIASPARVRSPRSVWLMFAIPFNFVEDFCIVADLAKGLRRDGSTPPHASLLWLILGQTWCGLQIASLFPGEVGIASGVLALIIWGWHWAYTSVIRRRIASLSVVGG